MNAAHLVARWAALLFAAGCVHNVTILDPDGARLVSVRSECRA